MGGYEGGYGDSVLNPQLDADTLLSGTRRVRSVGVPAGGATASFSRPAPSSRRTMAHDASVLTTPTSMQTYLGRRTSCKRPLTLGAARELHGLGRPLSPKRPL
jgi:hypothetical protein